MAYEGMRFFSDMTFLRGAAEFMGSFSAENPKAAEMYFKKFSQSTTKGLLIPNLYTQARREYMERFDVPIKETGKDYFTGLLDNLRRDIPVANNGMNDMIDALGDPVMPDTDRLASDVETDAIWDVIIKNKAWIGRLSKGSVIVYEGNTGKERHILSQDEYYEFTKARGQIIKKHIKNTLKYLQKSNPDEARTLINDLKNQATEEAKYKVVYNKK